MTMQMPKQGLNLHRGNPINLDVLDKISKVKNISINQPHRELSFYSALGRMTRLKHKFINEQDLSSYYGAWYIPYVKIKLPNQDLIVNNIDAPYYHRNLIKYGIIPRNILLEISVHYKTSETIRTASGGTADMNINDFETFILSIGPDGFYDHTSKKFNVVLFYWTDRFLAQEYHGYIGELNEITDPLIGILILPKIMFRDRYATLDPCHGSYAYDKRGLTRSGSRTNVLDYLYYQAMSRGLKILDIKVIKSKNVISIGRHRISKLYGRYCNNYAWFGPEESGVLANSWFAHFGETTSLFVLEYCRKFLRTNKPFEVTIYPIDADAGKDIEMFFFPKNPLFLYNFT